VAAAPAPKIDQVAGLEEESVVEGAMEQGKIAGDAAPEDYAAAAAAAGTEEMVDIAEEAALGDGTVVKPVAASDMTDSVTL
jgi:hypothetical protein